MPWTIEEIERDWLGGEHVNLPPDAVVGAFAAAERVRGREWVLNTTSTPGGGRTWGFAPFLRVYAFGKAAQAVEGAPGIDELLRKLLEDDAAAYSELIAIYLLRSRRPQANVEIGPQVTVGKRERRPDFRIRLEPSPWTYVEVTQLNASRPSTRTQEVLSRIADQVISVPRPFILEIVFWREPAEGEEDEIVRLAYQCCQEPDGHRADLRDLASLMVKTGEAGLVVPSILPPDDGTRMSIARSVVGPDQPNRQIMARVPFADQRAEDILTAEARQLPKDESGLVMVDVTRQPTAFQSWTELVPRRFTPVQHTRVGGVLLFMFATTITPQGLAWLPYVKLIANPHARTLLPGWINDVIEDARAESRRLTGRSD